MLITSDRLMSFSGPLSWNRHNVLDLSVCRCSCWVSVNLWKLASGADVSALGWKRGFSAHNAEEINIAFCRPVNNYTTPNMDHTWFLPPTLWQDNCVSMVTQSGAFTLVLHRIGTGGCYYLLANQWIHASYWCSWKTSFSLDMLIKHHTAKQWEDEKQQISIKILETQLRYI